MIFQPPGEKKKAEKNVKDNYLSVNIYNFNNSQGKMILARNFSNLHFQNGCFRYKECVQLTNNINLKDKGITFVLLRKKKEQDFVSEKLIDI